MGGVRKGPPGLPKKLWLGLNLAGAAAAHPPPFARGEARARHRPVSHLDSQRGRFLTNLSNL